MTNVGALSPPPLPPSQFAALTVPTTSVLAGTDVPIAGSSFCSYLQVGLKYTVGATGEERVNRVNLTAPLNGNHFSFVREFSVPASAAGDAVFYLDQACAPGDDKYVAEEHVQITAASPSPSSLVSSGRPAMPAHVREPNRVLQYGLLAALLAAVVLAAAIRRSARSRRDRSTTSTPRD